MTAYTYLVGIFGPFPLFSFYIPVTLRWICFLGLTFSPLCTAPIQVTREWNSEIKSRINVSLSCLLKVFSYGHRNTIQYHELNNNKTSNLLCMHIFDKAKICVTFLIITIYTCITLQLIPNVFLSSCHMRNDVHSIKISSSKWKWNKKEEEMEEKREEIGR